MKILMLAGSLRKDSLNKRLSHFAMNTIKAWRPEADLNFFELQGLNIPLYDGDIEKTQGIPEGIKSLIAEIAASDALIISSPEYNGSISSVTKTVLDWVSRSVPNVLAGKQVLLLGASPGALGAVRGLWHTRVPFEVLGCHVFPEMGGVGKAHEVLSADNNITDEKTKAFIERVLKNFTEYIS